ncbi:MAG: transglycosylase family protein [Acidimicrobiales bacterium]
MDGRLSLIDYQRRSSATSRVALSTQNRLNVFPIVTGAEKCPTTKPGLRCRVQRLAGVGAGMVGLSLVTAITATVVVPPGPVAADQVSNLKAQAAQIAQDLVLEQLQIGAYQQQYDVDIAKVQRDEAEIGSSEDQIQADISRVRRDRKRLQSEAVSAYINLDPEVSGTEALFENQEEAPTRAVYEEVASGDIALTIAALHTDENGLRAERATLGQQEAQDQATTNQEATLANAARQTEVQLTSKQSEITGELAVAVAQQQAAQAAAAAAAVRAAQAAAASPTSPAANRTPTSTTQPAPSATSTAAQGSAASTSSGDPSLPPFLQCVLQAESGGNYDAVSPGGTYMGGFQFSQATWNEAAELAGMPQLINVPPNEATPAEQDDLAIALYEADGQQSWDDSCRTS